MPTLPVRAVDIELSLRVQHALADTGSTRRLAILAARSADSWVCVVICLILWWLGEPDLGRRAVLLLLGILATALVVGVLKFVIRRERPVSDWGGSYRRHDPHSFPSGHAARVGMIATYAAVAFPIVVTVPLAAWALAVATARVALGVHYLSDVVVGLGIGAAFGLLTAAML